MKQFNLTLTAIFLGLFSGALCAAEDSPQPLLRQSGTFAKYSSCEIFDTHTTLILQTSRGGRIVETSVLEEPIGDISELLEGAIDGVKGVQHRWADFQRDYFAKSQDNLSTLFFAEGFTNVRNSSVQAKQLLQLMDDVCDSAAKDFRILGDFEINLLVGDTLFKDHLKVKRIVDFSGGSYVHSTYTVPGAFESRVTALNYENEQYSFEIHVKEGSQEYDAVFEGVFDSYGQLKGKAYVLPDRTLLGEFTGRKVEDE